MEVYTITAGISIENKTMSFMDQIPGMQERLFQITYGPFHERDGYRGYYLREEKKSIYELKVSFQENEFYITLETSFLSDESESIPIFLEFIEFGLKNGSTETFIAGRQRDLSISKRMANPLREVKDFMEWAFKDFDKEYTGEIIKCKPNETAEKLAELGVIEILDLTDEQMDRVIRGELLSEELMKIIEEKKRGKGIR